MLGSVGLSANGSPQLLAYLKARTVCLAEAAC
jgi:hypothetical protein